MGRLAGQLITVDADHGLAQPLTDLSQLLGILEVGHSLDNGLGARNWIPALENPRPHENAVASELHHEGGVGGRGDSTGGKVDDWETAQLHERV